MSPFILYCSSLLRCSAVLYLYFKLWAYSLGLNWDFRSKFFWVRHTNWTVFSCCIRTHCSQEVGAYEWLSPRMFCAMERRVKVTINQTWNIGFESSARGAAVVGVRVAVCSRNNETSAVRSTIAVRAFYSAETFNKYRRSLNRSPGFY